jgi:uroporphyrinogen-III decarboxylase
LRGTRGAMIDMYRNPDKLLKAIEKVTPWQIQWGVDGAKATGISTVGIFPHKGFKGLMSEEQYKTFYWPTLRQVILGLIDEGLTPFVFTEGDYTPRLEIIRDVPKGKVVYHIERDIFKAKEALGGVACLTGGPPSSLLCIGTVEEVKDYCKKLIDVVGKGGGYILNPEVPLIDENPENVKAMTDFFKEHGVYR